MSAVPEEHWVALHHGQSTDRGLRRALNEDSMLATDTLLLVADGMGGHAAGDVASSVCVQTFAEGVRQAHGLIDAQLIDDLLQRADRAILAAGSARAGTTVSGAAVIYPEGQPQWLIFNVGDSRTYRMADGLLEQVTVDHSEVQELLDSGQLSAGEAADYPRRHVITRALGMRADNRADFWMLPVKAGDRLLVCSDGLSGELNDEQMQQVLARFPDPQQAADELIQAALRNGGRDNISVIVADVAAGHPDDIDITVPRQIITTDTEEKS
ncbi:protein phosphatase 2C domain-containing protein [Glutamicibacter endophyticus]